MLSISESMLFKIKIVTLILFRSRRGAVKQDADNDNVGNAPDEVEPEEEQYYAEIPDPHYFQLSHSRDEHLYSISCEQHINLGYQPSRDRTSTFTESTVSSSYMENQMYTTSVSTLSDDSAYIETDARSNEASYLAQQSIDPTNRNRVQNESVVDQNRRQHPNNSLSTLSDGSAYIDNVTHPNPTRSEREFVSSENRPHEDESNSCTAEVLSDIEKLNSPNQVSVVDKIKRQCRNNSLSVISEDSAYMYIDNVSHPNQTNSVVESMTSSSCLNPGVNPQIGQNQTNCLSTHSESSAYLA